MSFDTFNFNGKICQNFAPYLKVYLTLRRYCNSEARILKGSRIIPIEFSTVIYGCQVGWKIHMENPYGFFCRKSFFS